MEKNMWVATTHKELVINYHHQKFQVPKMEGFLYLLFSRLFLKGGPFPLYKPYHKP